MIATRNYRWKILWCFTPILVTVVCEEMRAILVSTWTWTFFIFVAARIYCQRMTSVAVDAAVLCCCCIVSIVSSDTHRSMINNWTALNLLLLFFWKRQHSIQGNILTWTPKWTRLEWMSEFETEWRLNNIISSHFGLYTLLHRIVRNTTNLCQQLTLYIFAAWSTQFHQSPLESTCVSPLKLKHLIRQQNTIL